MYSNPESFKRTKEEFNTFFKTKQIFEKLGYDFDFKPPLVTVIGGESAGKSTVLEQLFALKIFPKKDGFCTKTPVLIYLRESPKPFIEIEWKKGLKKTLENFPSIEALCEKLREEVSSYFDEMKQVSKEKIDITIHIPSTYFIPICCLDLPGVTFKQPITSKILEEKLSKLDTDNDYFNLLVVSLSNQNINSDAVCGKIAEHFIDKEKELKKFKESTIAVLTKADYLEEKNLNYEYLKEIQDTLLNYCSQVIWTSFSKKDQEKEVLEENLQFYERDVFKKFKCGIEFLKEKVIEKTDYLVKKKCFDQLEAVKRKRNESLKILYLQYRYDDSKGEEEEFLLETDEYLENMKYDLYNKIMELYCGIFRFGDIIKIIEQCSLRNNSSRYDFPLVFQKIFDLKNEEEYKTLRDQYEKDLTRFKKYNEKEENIIEKETSIDSKKFISNFGSVSMPKSNESFGFTFGLNETNETKPFFNTPPKSEFYFGGNSQLSFRNTQSKSIFGGTPPESNFGGTPPKSSFGTPLIFGDTPPKSTFGESEGFSSNDDEQSFSNHSEFTLGSLNSFIPMEETYTNPRGGKETSKFMNISKQFNDLSNDEIAWNHFSKKEINLPLENRNHYIKTHTILMCKELIDGYIDKLKSEKWEKVYKKEFQKDIENFNKFDEEFKRIQQYYNFK